MKGIFITGTDTGVGKTIVTGLCARYLMEKGYRVITQKWIQTGSVSKPPLDVLMHLKIMGKDRAYIQEYLTAVCPYSFKFSASPHLASVREKKIIEQNKIIKSYRLLSQVFDSVIVEGVGGALVPFNRRKLVIDIVKIVDVPVLLVAQNKLGAINHTLLTIEALRRRGLDILGIIFNNFPKQNKIILEDNPCIIKELTREKILGVLPWVNDWDRLYKGFVPIGEKILKRLT